MFSRLLVRTKTAAALGLRNVARVVSYRVRMRAGLHPVQRLDLPRPPVAPFFDDPVEPVPLPAPRAWHTTANYFGWFTPDLAGGPPNWHRNLFTAKLATGIEDAWWTIPDFDPAVGDIKTIWEASRLDWVVNLAQRSRSRSMPDASIDTLNAWLGDWCAKNPPYRGHNWKCAQEASIRVMHLATASMILGQTRVPRPALVELLTIHLKRIAPTMSYAIGQDNNHGTSEAAALFIGGSWLGMLGDPAGRRWEALGRKWLENRADRLISPDGGFSQYSVNYHRFMLDTFSVAEVWRRHVERQAFSDALYGRIQAATEWLRTMVDPATGDAPNLGANDGANLLPLTDADYRDYRPSVQLASALFANRAAYSGPGHWEAHLRWLGVEKPIEVLPAPRSRLFDDGGFAVVRRGEAMAVLRYPRFRHRPSHADALHVDLWLAGNNLLRDGGSFSYADPEWHAYFTGALGHNTAQLDDREQMPRVARFLWGDWLRTMSLDVIQEFANDSTVGAAYADGRGGTHARRIELGEGALTITDTIGGVSRRAVLRWRLRPGQWSANANEFTDGGHVLSIASDAPITRCQIVEGWESRYYGQKTTIPVVEVEIANPGVVVTKYRWGR